MNGQNKIPFSLVALAVSAAFVGGGGLLFGILGNQPPEVVIATEGNRRIPVESTVDIRRTIPEDPQPILPDAVSAPSDISAAPPDNTQSESFKAEPSNNLTASRQIGFATDSAQLTETGKQTLNALLEEVKAADAQTIAVEVIGHTSLTGEARANQTLSEARANAVANYLKQTDKRFDVRSEGVSFNQPLPDADPADPSNQRTEVRLTQVD